MKKFAKMLIAGMGYDITKCSVMASDLDAFAQQHRLLTDVPAPIILDVGAHTGEVSRIYAKLFPNAMIHALEPFPSSFEFLQKNIVDLPQVIAHPIGLAETSCNLELNVNVSSPTNSLLETDLRAADTWGAALLDTQQRISCTFSTLDQFMSDVGLEHINLLKLDVQGAEQKVFDGAIRCFSDRLIDVIYMEIIVMPTYRGQRRIGEYMEFLEKNGMTLYGIYNLSHVSGRLRQIDAIFTRRLNHET